MAAAADRGESGEKAASHEKAVTLRMIDTFSGIGGFSLAARWLGGIETVQFVEREPYCQRILRKHWPTVPIHDDICTYEPEPGSADIICGGFPCQDISQSGKGAGLAGSRSGLFYELLRVVRLVGPRYVVLENVAAITHRGMESVLGALAEAGYNAEWACIPAAAVGACHQRDRWWCVAYANNTRMETARAKQQPTGIEQHREPAAYPHRQRQQKQHPPSIAAGAGQPAWPSAPQRLDSNWRGYLSEPVLCRGDDGLSGRVDRLKALGNAVVPQVAMIPLCRVLDLEQQSKAPQAET
jgi:DNA (cytosine-5)-methyltransferase 1